MSRRLEDRAKGKPLAEEWKTIKTANKELANKAVFKPDLDAPIARYDEVLKKYQALAGQNAKQDAALGATVTQLRTLEKRRGALSRKLTEIRDQEKAEFKKIDDIMKSKDDWEAYATAFADKLEDYSQLTKALNDEIFKAAQGYLGVIRASAEQTRRHRETIGAAQRKLQDDSDRQEKEIRQAIIAWEKIAVQQIDTGAIDGLKALLAKL